MHTYIDLYINMESRRWRRASMCTCARTRFSFFPLSFLFSLLFFRHWATTCLVNVGSVRHETQGERARARLRANERERERKEETERKFVCVCVCNMRPKKMAAKRRVCSIVSVFWVCPSPMCHEDPIYFANIYGSFADI